MKELRSLTYLLHPQDLFEGGLRTTIEQFAEGLAARTPLNIEVLLRASEMARLEMLLKRSTHSSSRFSCDKIIEAALS
ncbi:signal transduction histidine kinase [Bradyrhizobium japonicum]